MLPRKNHIILVLATLVALILACSGGEREISDQSNAPVAKIVPKTDTLHGDVRIDNYYWLRERSNPEVIEYLEAENEYTKQMMKHTEEFQDKLYLEMRARIKETDLSVPAKKGEYFYYSRNEENKQYKLYCRKKGSLDATEEILLDMNAIAEGHDYCALGAYSVSPDHNLLAYSIDTTGREKYALYFKDVTSGELLPDVVQDINWEAVWANDNKTIFYTTLDEALRPYRLWRHTLGTTQADDELVYQEDDQSYGLTVGNTRSDQFLLLELGSSVTSEVHFLSADNPKGEFRLIHPRQHGMEYYVSHHGNRFLIRTNDNALNFKLMDAPIADPSKDNWREVIAHRDSVLLEQVDAFQNHLAIIERERGLKRVRIIDVKSGA
ncbi:MAG: S9 family peptidase, partial [candidate division Zixibacteria bacterium]|nr:S9 family peptidase [candidate division Zixibacteria bacterium]